MNFRKIKYGFFLRLNHSTRTHTKREAATPSSISGDQITFKMFDNNDTPSRLILSI